LREMWVNIKVSGLLASFGEAFPLAVPGVYYWCIPNLAKISVTLVGS
jgi:hypothetical protein